MQSRAVVKARRRWVVLAAAVAVAVIGTMAPAASAKVAAKPKAKATKVKAVPKPKQPPRTGLIVSVCRFSHRLNDDPIVYPGLSGASHTHDFFGNATTNAHSTVASLTGHSTTCGVGGDTAAYWAPTVNVDGQPIKPAAMFAYYAVFGNAPVHPLPIGLKMIAKGAANVRFSCFSHSMPTAAFAHMQTCKPGQTMSIGINFPSCWDGKHLDSDDHMSHMAYPSYGVCPSSHPVKVPRVAVWLQYKSVPRGSLVTLSSGLLDSAHADYMNSWDPHTLATLERYCLDQHHECYKQMGRILRKLGLKHNSVADTVTAPPANS